MMLAIKNGLGSCDSQRFKFLTQAIISCSYGNHIKAIVKQKLGLGIISPANVPSDCLLGFLLKNSQKQSLSSTNTDFKELSWYDFRSKYLIFKKYYCETT